MADQKGRCCFCLFGNIKIRNGDWAIVFAESVVRRKGGIALREFGIWSVVKTSRLLGLTWTLVKPFQPRLRL
jgi:hypothetical protein